MKYHASLDGIRALAVGFVLAYHAHTAFAKGGYIGVDIFFVLSGFLITTLLNEQITHKGRIEFAQFYLRRSLRLFPALLLMIVTYLCLAHFFWPTYPYIQHVKDALASLFYVSNYSKAIANFPFMLAHTWSLACEEQYYLFWPLFYRLLTRFFSKSDQIKLLLFLFILATLWRIASVINGVPPRVTYFQLDTHISGLLLGSLSAVFFSQSLADKIPKALIWLAAILLITAVITYRWGHFASFTLGLTLVEACSLLIIFDALSNQPSALTRFLAAPPCVYIGKLSYGLYLWHFPIMYYLRVRYSWPITLGLGTALSLFCAALSYYTIENFAYRLFHQARYRRQTTSI
jgi:peptidoglycan/LPS O-acetylase OafA/YrhL